MEKTILGNVIAQVCPVSLPGFYLWGWSPRKLSTGCWGIFRNKWMTFLSSHSPKRYVASVPDYPPPVGVVWFTRKDGSPQVQAVIHSFPRVIHSFRDLCFLIVVMLPPYIGRCFQLSYRCNHWLVRASKDKLTKNE